MRLRSHWLTKVRMITHSLKLSPYRPTHPFAPPLRSFLYPSSCYQASCVSSWNFGTQLTLQVRMFSLRWHQFKNGRCLWTNGVEIYLTARLLVATALAVLLLCRACSSTAALWLSFPGIVSRKTSCSLSFQLLPDALITVPAGSNISSNNN